MKESIGSLWEERSKDYGTQITGVLPKSFPLPVNHYLHKWMFKQLKGVIPKNKKVKVLDLGCGYGRLSEEVLWEFPQSRTFGIDISPYYVSLYNKNLFPRGRAIFGDIRTLPFPCSTFDIVFMVTTLMYVTKEKDQEKVMSEIFRVLKRGGKFVIIERNPKGYRIITLGGLISKLRGKKFREITSVSFDKAYMLSLISRYSGSVFALQGIPFFTLFLPFSILTSFVSKSVTEKLLFIVFLFDRLFGWILTPSLYISYSGRKNGYF